MESLSTRPASSVVESKELESSAFPRFGGRRLPLQSRRLDGRDGYCVVRIILS